MEKGMSTVGLRLVVLVLSFYILTCSSSLAQEDRTEEINGYINTIQTGSIAHKIKVAKEITSSGLNDTRLFDVVEKELKDGFQTASGREPIDYMSWLCKALASSGLPQYKGTIEHVAQNTASSKLQRYAEQSLALFDKYVTRNEIMNQNSAAFDNKSPEVVRLISMIKSNMMDLKRDAAKEITRGVYKDRDLYEAVNQELLNGYGDASDNLAIDTMSWLCKALGSSGNAKYKKTLQKVKDSESPKLAKYAGQGYDMLP